MIGGSKWFSRIEMIRGAMLHDCYAHASEEQITNVIDNFYKRATSKDCVSDDNYDDNGTHISHFVNNGDPNARYAISFNKAIKDGEMTRGEADECIADIESPHFTNDLFKFITQELGRFCSLCGNVETNLGLFSWGVSHFVGMKREFYALKLDKFFVFPCRYTTPICETCVNQSEGAFYKARKINRDADQDDARIIALHTLFKSRIFKKRVLENAAFYKSARFNPLKPTFCPDKHPRER